VIIISESLLNCYQVKSDKNILIVNFLIKL